VSLWWGELQFRLLVLFRWTVSPADLFAVSLTFIAWFSHSYALIWSLIPLQHTIISEPLVIDQETLIKPCVQSILFTCYLFNDAKNNSRIWRPMLANIELRRAEE
jgi:hypothetical protein